MSIQKSYVVCIYVQYTDILFRYKVPEPNTHVPHHTQRGTDSTDGGGAFGAAPIGSIIFPLCVVWMLAVFCVARVCASLAWVRKSIGHLFKGPKCEI